MPRNSSHSADHSSHTASDRDANFQQQTFACSAGNCLMALQQTQLLCSKPVLLAVQQTCTACFAASLYCLLCSKPVCNERLCTKKHQVKKVSLPHLLSLNFHRMGPANWLQPGLWSCAQMTLAQLQKANNVFFAHNQYLALCAVAVTQALMKMSN